MKLNAFIIKSYDYSNTSKIVEVFTNDYGKMSLLIKGAKRNKRISGLIDNFNKIEFELNRIKDKGLHNVYKLSLLNKIQLNDYDIYDLLSYIFQVVDKNSLPLHSDKKSYLLLDHIIRHINLIETNNIRIFKIFFDVKFLKVHGYLDKYFFCETCKKQIDLNGFYYKDNIYCKNCISSNDRSLFIGKQDYKKLILFFDYNTVVKLVDIFQNKDLIVLDKFCNHYMVKNTGH